MFNKRYQPVLWIIMSVVFVAMLLLSGSLTSPVVQAGLPDRDDPTPTPSSSSSGDDDGDDGSSSSSPLAHIELFVSPTPIGVEGVVQWLNVNGEWEDVGGWTHNLQSGYQRWAVEAKDFNTGPFRWIVRNSQSGVVVGSSDSFTLPSGGETLQMTVVLP